MIMAAATGAYAQDTRLGPAVGKVHTVFVEVARGLLIERKLVGNRMPGEQVIEIGMSRTSATPEMYLRAPASAAIEAGDLVVVHPNAGALVRDDAHFYEIPYLAEIKAKHDTLEALLFMRHPLATRTLR